MTIYTIGVYGFTEKTFVDALKHAGITALVDIRRRRAMRGPRYRFANATALESVIVQNSIKYLAVPTLAPTQQMRKVQRNADAQVGIAKGDRTELAAPFKSAYANEVLARFSDAALKDLLRQIGDRPCLFCVERVPDACHRSLAATWICQQTNSTIVDLEP